MYILNIETATRNCSVSLSKNGVTVAVKDFAAEGFSHAELLHVFIEDVLAIAKVDFNQLHAIAVSQGPGSYTGLRIGVSAAKGLCFALDIPLIAIDTLKVLAKQVKIEKGLIIPMIDARRMEVYSAAFDEELNIISPTKAEILDEFSYQDIEQPIYIVGDCQEKVKTVLSSSKFIFVEDIKFPSAKDMSFLSFEKYRKQDFADLAYFEPLYLKEFLITSPKKMPL